MGQAGTSEARQRQRQRELESELRIARSELSAMQLEGERRQRNISHMRASVGCSPGCRAVTLLCTMLPALTPAICLLLPACLPCLPVCCFVVQWQACAPVAQLHFPDISCKCDSCNCPPPHPPGPLNLAAAQVEELRARYEQQQPEAFREAMQQPLPESFAAAVRATADNMGDMAQLGRAADVSPRGHFCHLAPSPPTALAQRCLCGADRVGEGRPVVG
mgnify:CR=1 FL=1